MQRMKLTAVMLVGVFAEACSTTQAEPENWVVYGGGGLPDRARVEAVVPEDGADLNANDVILRLAPVDGDA